MYKFLFNTPFYFMIFKNKVLFLSLLSFFCGQLYKSQIAKDSLEKDWTLHGQLTIIGQKHSGFPALYSGQNSLNNAVEPTATSVTSTLFLGRKLWKNAAFYLNPEMAGGKGLSFAQGVAGALNGETYRVGEVAPQVFIARAYLQQHFALNHEEEFLDDDENQLAQRVPKERITLNIGKFAISDFFDDSPYAKDPRTQFMNWAVWANGSWDYPANTRGYTFGVVAELIKPLWEFRLSTVAVPKIANYKLMEYNGKAHSETVEITFKPLINHRQSVFKLIISNTYSRAPSYEAGIAALRNNNQFLLDVIKGNAENNTYGGRKLMLGFNYEQQVTENLGIFSRIGWNDGKYVTWAFTEIDNNLLLGASLKGKSWNRKDDTVGLAVVTNGISKPHQEFLKLGGNGFILGDGNLNYRRENIIETYYAAQFNAFWQLSFDYQLVLNPGYNNDRGPVHVFALRSHFSF